MRIRIAYSSVIYAKTIEECAKVLGPTWYGVSWFSQNLKFNSYHSSLIIGVNHPANIRHTTGGNFKLSDSYNDIITSIPQGVNKTCFSFSESKSDTNDANTTPTNEHSETVIHSVTKDDTHALTETNDDYDYYNNQYKENQKTKTC
ncbi:hypothetical protein PIROE2DRAFT_16175 [Piromyces sp. E2]|nr:hypothetical protein PIROE2DRAFT_16175 [Piromyces sp. E2]|eukprot:OUM58513.1 hypothetical protein PIROE2DRAFT_16175 [Piromyces sp. E2]